MSVNRKPNRKPRSSRARNRRLAQQQANKLNFDKLEDRQLLASVTVGNATDLVNADTSSIFTLINNDGGDGISLREAITASNNTVGEDTITFDGSVFDGGANSLIRLTQGELEITDSLNIDASAAMDVTITGDADGDDITVAGTFITDVAASFGETAGDSDDLLDDNSRVLNFSSATGDLTLNGLTLTGGRTTGDNAFIAGLGRAETTHSGGGILFNSSGNLTLVDSTVSGNSLSGRNSYGGGVSTVFGSVSLLNSTVSENFTSGVSGRGGGIHTESGNVSLNGSSLINNGTSGGSAYGGGISTFYGSVSVSNSTVNGNSTEGIGAGGGGIFNRRGNISLTNSSVSENRTLANVASGGGVSTISGEVTLLSSTVSGNSTSGAQSDGGGIHAYAGIYLTDSTVNGNSTGGEQSEGGGIFLYGGIFTQFRNVSLTNSTVSGNSSSGGGGISAVQGVISLLNSTVDRNNGGGIDVTSNSGLVGGIQTDFNSVSLINSTVSGNDGGGIRAGAAFVSLLNSTVTENTANGIIFDDFFVAGGVGGIEALSGDVSIVNSIVAGNFSNISTVSPDLLVGGDNLVVEHSLIGDATNSGITATTGTGNILNQPALLGPLADNGGPTLTHALLPDSLAINAGNNTFAEDTEGVPLINDQRGAGFDRIQVGAVDIGAFESDFDTSVVPPTLVSVTINEGGVLNRPDLWNTLTVVFDTDVDVSASSLILFNDLPTGNPLPLDLTGIGFSYDVATNTAIWDFSTLDPLLPGIYTYQLDANSITAGNVTLDSDGDGVRGDDFVDQLYVAIPGDANLDGRVDISNDAFTLVGNLNTTTGASFADGDFNGDGRVDVLGDAFILVANLNRNVDLVTDVVVSNNTDLVNADTSSVFALIADDGGDGISLREAIVASNNATGSGPITFDGTITFDGSVFVGGADSLIRLTQGELEITDGLTIDASLATDVTITGDANGDDVLLAGTFITDVTASFGGTADDANDLLNDNSRVLNFSGTTGDLTLAGLTLTGGRTTIQDGGGVYFRSDGSLIIESSFIAGNSASGDRSSGGGVASESGSLSLLNSTISNNSTSGDGFTSGGAFPSFATTGGGGISTNSGSISLNNSTIINNNTSGSDSVGGGIFSASGDVLLDNSSVIGNNTSGSTSEGGGIATNIGDIILHDSVIGNNSTSGFGSRGGGVSTFQGSVSLVNSSLSGNSTSGVLSQGGGIFADLGSVSLENSVLHDNSTSGFYSPGGGIFVAESSFFTAYSLNFVSLTNSTISGNSTSGTDSRGGGIYSLSGTIALINSTVTGNSVANAYAGGIFVADDELSQSVTIVNSIVAGNTDNGTAPDFLTTGNDTVTINHSLIGDTAGSAITAATGTGNILNQPALIGPLADNGGATLTHALLPSSPAIDAGNNTLEVDANGAPLTTDQRGEGFDRLFGSSVDIGAFELQPVAATAQLVLAGDDDLRDDIFGSEF